MYYDVDLDVVYWACLTQAELLLLIIFCVFIWEFIKYIVRTEFLQ